MCALPIHVDVCAPHEIRTRSLRKNTYADDTTADTDACTGVCLVSNNDTWIGGKTHVVQLASPIKCVCQLHPMRLVTHALENSLENSCLMPPQLHQMQQTHLVQLADTLDRGGRRETYISSLHISISITDIFVYYMCVY